MDQERFGNCAITGSCEHLCPKEIGLDFIAKMDRHCAVALIKGGLKPNNGGGAGQTSTPSSSVSIVATRSFSASTQFSSVSG